jgi:4-hydroxy-3-methylbut-2-en-1-yl diphosphate reductase
MIVAVDHNSGFCFGVKAAVQKAEEILVQRDSLYCLGEIVHNETEVERLSKMGLTTIDHDQFFTLSNTAVLLRAHGEPPSTYHYARQNNIQLIDATCPIVVKLQKQIHADYISTKRLEGQLIIYGKRGHAEVNGLVGQTDDEAIIIEHATDLEQVDFSRPISLYAQTTKDLHGFHQLAGEIQRRAISTSVKIHDTICRQVSNRIPGIIEFAKRYPLILFVSGLKSSNGRMLFEICLSQNPNSKFISCLGDISVDWFKDVESVGICGATSTPKETLEQMAEALRVMVG